MKILNYNMYKILSYSWLVLGILDVIIFFFIEKNGLSFTDVLLNFAFYEIFSIRSKMGKEDV